MSHLNSLQEEQISLLLLAAAAEMPIDHSPILTPAQAAALFPNPLIMTPSSFITSITNEFPAIKPTVLLSICTHTFDPDDLYTLDPQYSRRVSEGGYPTFSALFQPLGQYFQVLISFASTSGNAGITCIVANSTTQYLVNLVKFEELYQWPAVLAYHMAFHRKRVCEMMTGQYGGWADIDGGLHAKYLFGKEKARQEGLHSGSGRRRGKRGGGKASCVKNEGTQ